MYKYTRIKTGQDRQGRKKGKKEGREEQNRRNAEGKVDRAVVVTARRENWVCPFVWQQVAVGQVAEGQVVKNRLRACSIKAIPME